MKPRLKLAQTEVVAEVAAFAAIAHNGQRRRGNGSIPYIVHPARVATLVTNFGGDWRAVAASWLHDVAEDCPGRDVVAFVNSLKIPTPDKMTIIHMVAALTKNPAIKPRRKRLEEHLEMIRHAPPQTALVKLCDRIDNLVMNEYEVVEDKIDGMKFPKFLNYAFLFPFLTCW